ncbi:MAG: hypothetical protein GQ535_03485 [Rhodobacteraceae bacterium]|nr:hypothetical protein [Paracoccaceae bacterium]
MKHTSLSALRKTLINADFVHIPDLVMLLPQSVIDADNFRAHWDTLVLDENFKSYTTRHRRILRYHYTHPGTFVLNEDSKYVPTVTYDVDYKQGANKLTYATQAFIVNPLMTAILKADLSIIDAHLEEGVEYMVDINLFRVSSFDGRLSPTTSGRHQDGQDWIFMHLIDTDNIEPVVSELAITKEAVDSLFKKPMTKFLETLCVNDRKLWHAAGPVVQHKPEVPAKRDLLLVSVVRKDPTFLRENAIE